MTTLLALALLAIPVSDRRQLFIDRKFIEKEQGIELRVHSPRKAGPISLAGDDGPMGGTTNCVMKDGAVYRLWYLGRNGFVHARSRDGVHFEKDRLVLGGGAGGIKGIPRGLMVFIDPNAPAAERYRMVTRAEEISPVLQLFSSPDGLTFKHTHRDVITFHPPKPHHLDSQNVIFWDARIGKYAAYVRRNLQEKGSQGRGLARAESADLARWPEVQEMPVVLPPWRGGQVDVYTNGTILYPWAENAYLMFPCMYYHYTTRQSEFAGGAPVNAGVIDAYFAASRDGVKWDTYQGEPWVRLGMEGEFDSKRIYMAYGMVPAPNGRELYMYYMGTNEPHGWNRDDRNNRLLIAANVAPRPEARALGRLVLRRDGFVSVHASEAGGEFTTPAIAFRGRELLLNVDTSALGEAQVEIQDENGKTLAASGLIHTANDPDRVVKFDGEPLERLAGKPVRLRFLLRNADVYAFQFR
ncbi:MAG: hypothetical protein ACE15B_00675 [Bryobacteraceae bacterium]